MYYWMHYALIGILALLLATQVAQGATEDLGNGFLHHGVATPVSSERGLVCTADGQGRDVVLTWLFDARGGYALLMIDAETGKAEQIPMPFDPGGDCPYSSILSSGNKFYTHFNSNFCEFDPVTRKFTFTTKTAPQMAMSMTEDDKGVIYSVTYPNSGVVSFNPKTREFKDFGHVYAQNWPQYQRYAVCDDTGWLYFGVGNTAGQIVALDPTTGKAKPILAENERVQGSASVYRDMNGKVYGCSGGQAAKWMELYKGERKDLDAAPTINKKPIITDSQSLNYTRFPSGKQLAGCDLQNRLLTIKDPKTGETKTLRFDYTSEGADIMGVATAPNDTICGGTAFPMRFFCYNPATDAWTNEAAYCQSNTVARQGSKFYVGGYTGGYLTEWDPSQPWVDTVAGKAGCNPQFLTQGSPDIYRPHHLLAHPDGHTLILAGTPDYGFTGGGLLFWDRNTGERVLLTHEQLIPQHSTMSLAAIANGKILGGTTIEAGTGGEIKAKEAQLYILDMATKKLDWHAVVIPGVSGYTDLCPGPGNLVFGVADGHIFFVFDTEKRALTYQKDLAPEFGYTANGQGPRVFIRSPHALYMLFGKGIARLDEGTFAIKLLAQSPVSVATGGDYLNGRIYFANGAHLYSWKVPETATDQK